MNSVENTMEQNVAITMPEETENVAMENAVEQMEDEENEEFSKDKHFKKSIKPLKKVTEEDVEETTTTLLKLFSYLDLQGTIKTEVKERSVNLLISSKEAGKIIGHHGVNLESLQIILNRIMQKKYPDFPRIYLDIASPNPNIKKAQERKQKRDGHETYGRGKRHFSYDKHSSSSFGHDDKLRQQALDAAKEVRLFSESKTMPLMNAHDRRIIHITLENEKDIKTESIGDGAEKSVVISLIK